MENYFGYNIFMVSNKQYGIRLLIGGHTEPPPQRLLLLKMM